MPFKKRIITYIDNQKKRTIKRETRKLTVAKRLSKNLPKLVSFKEWKIIIERKEVGIKKKTVTKNESRKRKLEVLLTLTK